MRAPRNTVRDSLLALLFALILLGTMAFGQDRPGREILKANLASFEQVPSVLATGHGRFEAEINHDNTVSWRLFCTDMTARHAGPYPRRRGPHTQSFPQ